MNKKVITFGEIMLRLTPPDQKRIVQTDTFNVIYGGGEANVAVSLANYGIDANFVTKLPENPVGQAAFNELRRYGVKTDYIARGGERLGIYFCEDGASQRPSNVIYDRFHSAIAEATNDDFDWDDIFN
ncbi:MAG: PfkB family carbohydrate kinase, partial [Halanaerobiales bacterium]